MLAKIHFKEGIRNDRFANLPTSHRGWGGSRDQTAATGHVGQQTESRVWFGLHVLTLYNHIAE